MEPKKEPKRDPKTVPKGGPGEDTEKGDLISSISMPVSNGMLTFGTCLSKEREARLTLGKLRRVVTPRKPKGIL